MKSDETKEVKKEEKEKTKKEILAEANGLSEKAKILMG